MVPHGPSFGGGGRPDAERDKFHAYAEARGLPIPRTVTVSELADLERAVKSLTFPVP